MGIDSPFQVKCLEKKKAHERKRKTKLIALQKVFISIVYFVKGLNPGVISKG